MLRRILRALGGVVLLSGLVTVAVLTRESWLPWIMPAEQADDPAAGAVVRGPSEVQQAKLTAQAQQNLGLVAKPITLQTYWRTIQVPGMIVDHPGVSDRTVAAQVAGVVTSIDAHPGDTVKSGDRLFTLRLTGESLQTTQKELFTTSREIQITQDLRKSLTDSGFDKVNPGRTLEVDNQLRRLTASAQASRQDLLARGLSRANVESAARGEFITEMEVIAPPPGSEHKHLVSDAVASRSSDPGVTNGLAYEVHELKVDIGQQVQAGQTLCLLANHQSLYIEGHSFKREAPLLEQAAQKGWQIRVEVPEEDAQHWPALDQTFTIDYLANVINPTSRTFAFYLPLTNQSRAYQKEGKTFLVWRFRPGQRVRLHVPVEEFGKKDGKDEEKVIVLPAAAVVREGPEAYVFRQNGDLFERRPVHVLYEDRLNIVLANDGSVRPGIDYLAQGAAASLNRIVKAQNASGGLPPGAHFHADGSLHMPGQ